MRRGERTKAVRLTGRLAAGPGVEVLLEGQADVGDGEGAVGAGPGGRATPAQPVRLLQVHLALLA